MILIIFAYKFRGSIMLQLKAWSLKADFLGSNIRSITYQLCDLDKVT